MGNDHDIPVFVLGGTGYVAGECLRLLGGHPVFRSVTPVSASHPGTRVDEAFPHLRGTAAGALVFSALEDALATLGGRPQAALLAATPHGATAELVDRFLSAAERQGCLLTVVDLSADFRFRDPERYRSLYGGPHGAPHRLPAFRCALPEQVVGVPETRCIAHPGCFTTAAVLAAWPFVRAGVVEPEVFVSAVTGSSGSGRSPGPGTHHPDRRSDLRAYAPMAHRHEAEMAELLSAETGEDHRRIQVDFVPHSGPLVRGIHATIRLRLIRGLSSDEAARMAREAYRDSPFVEVGTEPPRLVEVVGTQRVRLGVVGRGRTLVVLSVLDNLVKGAAGGGVQWLNRLFGLPDDAGLRIPGLGWL